jgi:small-conductance mechanosensitive channel
MSVTASSQPSNENQELLGFLRQLAGMMPGGKNAERLEAAASMIEALMHRASTAEQSCREQREDHARILRLHEAAELSSDHRHAEIAALKTRLAESNRQTESERIFFAEEARRLRALVDDAEAQLKQAQAELDELRGPVTAIDHSIAIVPVESLRLARAQFAFLASGFAEKGDVISQTICEIGACAIEKAMAGNLPPAIDPLSPLAKDLLA